VVNSEIRPQLVLRSEFVKLVILGDLLVFLVGGCGRLQARLVNCFISQAHIDLVRQLFVPQSRPIHLISQEDRHLRALLLADLEL
jgi:hypothetical protein